VNVIANIIKHSSDLRLLYVEDNQAAREATLLIFNEFFNHIVVGVDGQDGVEKFQKNKIDIIITDINMPRLNGLEMTKQIRSLNKDVPILVLSAYNESGFFMDSIKLGVDGYLLKPIDMGQFIEALKKIISKIEITKEVHLLHQYQDITDLSTIVSKTNLDGNITYVNEAYCKLSKYSSEELLGQSYTILRHPSVDSQIYKELWQTIKEKKEIWRGVLKNITKDGNTFYLQTTIKPLLDIDNNITEYISIKSDITHSMNQKKRLIDISDNSDDIVLILIKIENFDDIEKYYGQKFVQIIEDAFAQTLSTTMKKTLKLKNIFTLGDGEYAFINHTKDCFYTRKELKKKLLEFQEQINNSTVNFEGIEYDISILISLSIGKDSYENASYGLKKLHDSKKIFITANNLLADERENAHKNFEMLKMIKESLSSNNIVIYSQAIVDNKTEKTHKYESLVRLIDSEGNVISPYFFLNIAKKGKYYYLITQKVLEQSFALLDKVEESISINLSALDIERTRTRRHIFELLEKHKEHAHKIVFELLEDEEMKDFKLIKDFISKVKVYGVEIAIDDFGAGFSNFERLLDYQPDILKLDACLIKNIDTDSYSQDVVETIVSFAKKQGIKTVAEYVESEAIYKKVKSLGIDYSQGYYFAKPQRLKT